jgi:hypothetical protein
MQHDPNGIEASASGAVASNVAAPPQLRAISFDPERFFLISLVDTALAWVRRTLRAEVLPTSSRFLTWLGLWSLVVFAALALLGGVMVTIAMEDGGAAIGLGLVAAIVVLALLYVAAKFCQACGEVVDAAPSMLSRRAFLDCLALVAVAMAVVSVLAGLAAAIAAGQWASLLGGLVGGAFWTFLIAVSLHPELVRTTVEPGVGPGRELLGIVSFLLKSVLRLVPIVFGVAASAGAFGYLVAMVRFLPAEGFERMARAGEMGGLAAAMISTALAPLLIYFTVLLLHLIVDALSSILRIGGGDTVR